MKVKELTKAIDELSKTIEIQDSFRIQQLRDLVKELDAEATVYLHTLLGVARILDEFWQTFYSTNSSTPVESLNIAITPWIAFQQNLMILGFENVDHPQRYQQLAAEFTASNSDIELTKLMPLLTRIARLLGYAEQKSLGGYPFDKISREILDREFLAHEQSKYRTIITMLGALFIVLHSHCTAEQLKLLPQLCEFRFMTTDEERCSEKAILDCLTERVLQCRIFFNKYQEYIDARALKITEEIKPFKQLLPDKLNLVIQNLNKLPWEKILVKQIKDNDHETMAKRLLDDFSALADHSHEAAMALSGEIKKQIAFLPKEKIIFIHTMLYCFCLNAYSQDRDEKLIASSFFAFSKDTKCNAATKKAKCVNGEVSSFNWFEFFALKQGRLGKLIDNFEAEKSCLTN
ncbi:hypothetical protein [Legionella cardiaca]|uniref:Substrate of the Dot/Icm secretion system n=1 Tax=Legionella cardiaca TaxID=1071983 RepID=A0ABY8ATP2_9GAMM|nr:hypothetical protein [Legionella cardiaca]WED42880.1 hypothetical protein PXX05_13400 [Legionella cardiaca]